MIEANLEIPLYANLKIPLMLITKFKVSGIALLVYGELNGLYSKNHTCYVTDNTLMQRLNTSKASIQRAMHDLRSKGLIISKQKPNYKGRSVTVPPLYAKKFLLIPVLIIRNKNLNTGQLLLYGSLYSRQKKLIKINTDKKQENAPLIISVTKSDLAQELNIDNRTIRRQLKELEKKKYIDITSNSGINIEIILNPVKKLVDNSKIRGRPLDNLCQKRVSTYDKNDVSPMTKMSIHIPNVNDMPPLQENESGKEITELNQLDHDSTQQVNATKTGNSGSGGKAKSKEQKQDHHSSQQVNATETGNKPSRDARKEHHPDPKSQENKYEAYNGFNLEYQVNQLKNILDAKTGKHYVINAYQRPLIKQQLDNDYSLNDFAKAIDYLIQHKEAISVKDLATHLPNYLSKINSN